MLHKFHDGAYGGVLYLYDYIEYFLSSLGNADEREDILIQHSTMNRRRFLASAAALTGVTLLSGLSGCKSARALRVGIHPWIGYETLHLARDLNWLEPGIVLVENKDLSATASQLQAGEIEAGCLTLDEVIRLRSAGVPVSVALVFDVSAGADVLLARPHIRRLRDLAGKRICLEKNSLGFLMLEKALEAANLPESAVKLLDCPPERQLEVWRRKETDAIIAYEPNVALLQREGADRLFDSRQMPELIFDVLAVRTDRLDGQVDNLDGLIQAHFQGLAHLQHNRQDALYRIAAYQKISPADVQHALAGISLPSQVANRAYLSGANPRLKNAIAIISLSMLKHGYLKQGYRVENILAATWLPRE